MNNEQLEILESLVEGYYHGDLLEEDYKRRVSEVLPQWISVNDRLPERRQKCLIWIEPNIISCEYRDGTFYGVEYIYQYQPNFWMPLPEPPKE